MRSHENERQESKHTPETPVAPEKRRPFPEPTLTKHERLTQITLVSGDFSGGGFGGSGATFF